MLTWAHDRQDPWSVRSLHPVLWLPWMLTSFLAFAFSSSLVLFGTFTCLLCMSSECELILLVSSNYSILSSFHLFRYPLHFEAFPVIKVYGAFCLLMFPQHFMYVSNVTLNTLKCSWLVIYVYTLLPPLNIIKSLRTVGWKLGEDRSRLNTSPDVLLMFAFNPSNGYKD